MIDIPNNDGELGGDDFSGLLSQIEALVDHFFGDNDMEENGMELVASSEIVENFLLEIEEYLRIEKTLRELRKKIELIIEQNPLNPKPAVRKSILTLLYEYKTNLELKEMSIVPFRKYLLENEVRLGVKVLNCRLDGDNVPYDEAIERGQILQDLNFIRSELSKILDEIRETLRKVDIYIQQKK